MQLKSIIIETLVIAAVPAAFAPAAENWTSFHNGGNTSVDAPRLPLSWSPKEGVDWQVELPGYGQSAPVLWRGRVYATAVDGERKERCVVLALDADTGKRLWTQNFGATVKGKTSYMVSRAAPTPLVDDDGLYVMFESGDVIALTHDGERRWHLALFDDAQLAFQNGHGYGASPAQTADAVIVLVDHRGPSYLAAISKETGKTLWKTERSARSSWTSPHVTRVGERTQVVVSSGGTVEGYDATTGERLWSHEGISGNVIPSATVAGERVFVGASVDREGGNAQSAASSNCCLHIEPSSSRQFKVVWRAEKAVCHYVSPLKHENCVYYVNKVGVIYCLDATTGKQHYAERIAGACWAQPIAAGDRVYFFGKDGVTTVLKAGPECRVLATNCLWSDDAPPLPKRGYEYEPQGKDDTRPRDPAPQYIDPIVYSAVCDDESFFIRLGTHLYRVSQ